MGWRWPRNTSGGQTSGWGVRCVWAEVRFPLRYIRDRARMCCPGGDMELGHFHMLRKACFTFFAVLSVYLGRFIPLCAFGLSSPQSTMWLGVGTVWLVRSTACDVSYRRFARRMRGSLVPLRYATCVALVACLAARSLPMLRWGPRVGGWRCPARCGSRYGSCPR